MSVWEAAAVGDPKKLIEGFPDCFVAAFTVGQAKALGLQVEKIPGESGHGHCHVVGKKTQSVQSNLAKSSIWALGPKS